jgi:fluoride exporter
MPAARRQTTGRRALTSDTRPVETAIPIIFAGSCPCARTTRTQPPFHGAPPPSDDGPIMTRTLVPLIYVGFGGLVGSMLRYLTTLATQGFSMAMPYGTLISNLAGCFIIGTVTEVASRSEVFSTDARLFLATGLCGGFTTLSSVIYEISQFLQDKEYFYASAYFAVTFMGALLSFLLGAVMTSTFMR